MQEIRVQLKAINDVKDFVEIVSRFQGEAVMKTGKYVIDAKSILAIYSLDLSKPVTLSLENPGREELDSLQRFIVE
ncbi:MAG: HPr family phosphocarrier protein [Lachnospiraceae bacterium]|jgi:phosphocarrier protein HPr|nr:HPr family phosphocarrier protein [Lachnospiraceae bacterium]